MLQSSTIMRIRSSRAAALDAANHWENKSPINDRLTALFEPLTETLTAEFTEARCPLSAATAIEQLSAESNVYEFAYGRVGMLPPALFGNITKHAIELTEPLIVPETVAAQNRLVHRFIQWEQAQADKHQYTRRDTLSHRGILYGLDELAGQEYPEARWYQAARQVQLALRQEPLFTIDAHFMNRLTNAIVDHDQLRPKDAATHAQYDTYVLALSRTIAKDGLVDGTRDYAQLPVGAYGLTAAAKLARVTIAINDAIKGSQLLASTARELLTDENTATVLTYTARGNDKIREDIFEPAVHGVSSTLSEGILTVSQVLSLLTAEGSNAFDTHDQFIAAILSSDIIEKFTRLVPPGYVGPSTLSGVHLTQPLDVRNGSIKLSGQTLEFLHDRRKVYQLRQRLDWARYDARRKPKREQQPGQLGLVCPAAKPLGAITTAKKAFKLFYAA